MKKNKFQIKAGNYFYAFATFAILFLSFTGFMRIDSVIHLTSTNSFTTTLADDRVMISKFDQLLVSDNTVPMSPNNIDRTTVIIGSYDIPTTTIISNQLYNLRENYYTSETFSSLSESDIDNTDVFFLTKKDASNDVIESLCNLSKEGKVIVFMGSLNQSHFSDPDIRMHLGIKEYIGESEFEAYRISKDLGFYAMQEEKDISFTASEIVLHGENKKYAYAIFDEDSQNSSTIANEELPPLLWRHSSNGASIYVSSTNVFSNMLAYSMITEVYTQLQNTYIYPTINAYLLLVNGMPYATNFSSDTLSTLYTRDALGVQNSIFFPLFNSAEERYNTVTTWYSPESEKLETTTNGNVNYYLDHIGMQGGEIAKNLDGRLISDTSVLNEAIEWDSSFSFINEGDGLINIPIISTPETFEDGFIQSNSVAKTLGLVSVKVDVSDYLKENPESWVDFSLDFDSLLSVHSEIYNWLDNVTASEAAKRITNFLTINPTYTYTEDKVIIDIQNYTRESYFIINTNKEIDSYTNAEITKIGDNVFLVRAFESKIEIFLSNEKLTSHKD